MQCHVGEVTIDYVEDGSGVPLVALHGVGVDHREVEAALEPVLPRKGFRRIYPDLPGMGRSNADGLAGNNDVVAVLARFLERVAAGPVLLIGHSYGAYLARGVAAKHPQLVRGLALFCPIGASTGDIPPHEVVHEDAGVHDLLEPALRAGFDEYFVVRTAATADRYRDHVAPGVALADEAALGRIFADWTIEVGGAVTVPTLIVAGRHDATVGYADAVRLLEDYPHAALAVVEDAGHALLHERPELVGALLADWLRRAGDPGG